MALLKSADVIGATHAIKRDLGIGHGSHPAHSSQGGARPRSEKGPGLAEILRRLNAARAQFARADLDRPQPDICDADERFTSHVHIAAAGRVNYKLYVPTDQGRELALVLMLHGCTQNPDDFSRGTQMNKLAEEFGLIIAYPHQPRAANAQGCWNWFDPRHQQRGSGEPAILASLAQELGGRFNVNATRIFVAGLSAGGAMADVLASTYPTVFAAAGIHSGLPYGAATDVVSAFAAMKGNPTASPTRGNSAFSRKIVFHGGADATVHPSNAKRLFEGVRQASGNSATIASDSEINGRRVTRTLLDSANGEALAEHWLIHGAGHAWSGGDPSGSFADASGPDASRLMIQFFLGL